MTDIGCCAKEKEKEEESSLTDALIEVKNLIPFEMYKYNIKKLFQ